MIAGPPSLPSARISTVWVSVMFRFTALNISANWSLPRPPPASLSDRRRSMSIIEPPNSPGPGEVQMRSMPSPVQR